MRIGLSLLALSFPLLLGAQGLWLHVQGTGIHTMHGQGVEGRAFDPYAGVGVGFDLAEGFRLSVGLDFVQERYQTRLWDRDHEREVTVRTQALEVPVLGLIGINRSANMEWRAVLGAIPQVLPRFISESDLGRWEHDPERGMGLLGRVGLRHARRCSDGLWLSAQVFADVPVLRLYEHAVHPRSSPDEPAVQSKAFAMGVSVALEFGPLIDRAR